MTTKAHIVVYYNKDNQVIGYYGIDQNTNYQWLAGALSQASILTESEAMVAAEESFLHPFADFRAVNRAGVRAEVAQLRLVPVAGYSRDNVETRKKARLIAEAEAKIRAIQEEITKLREG